MTVRIFGDSTVARDIPQWVDGVAGYVDGDFAWTDSDWALFGDRPQIRYNVTGAPDRGNAADIEPEAMTNAQVLTWWEERTAAKVPSLAVYVNRDNIDEVMAFMEPHDPFIILSTLDGSCPQYYHGHKLAAVQFAGTSLTGGHYDLTIVYDDDFHPSPSNGPDAVLIASARKLAGQMQAQANRLAAITNAI